MSAGTGWIYSEHGWTAARNWARRLRLVGASALGIAVAATIVLQVVNYSYLWTPLQRHYIGTYRQTVFPPFPLFGKATADYQLLVVTGPSGGPEYLATDRDVRELEAGRFELSPAARQAGVATLEQRTYRNAPDAAVYWTLRRHIYAGRSLAGLWWFPRYAGIGIFLGLLIFGIVKDQRETEENRRWKTEPGQPLEFTPEQFNQHHQGDGVGFLVNVEGRPSPVAMRIPANYEVQHFALLGDTGSGKTVGMMQLMDQVRERGEAAIIYDPFGEFAARHFAPGRGDHIIHCLDARSPAWALEDELRGPQDFDNLVEAMYPLSPGGHDAFWVESARAVMRQLLHARPSPRELIQWLTDEEELDKRLEGTLAAKRVIKEAPAQRSGVLSHLSKGGAALSWLAMEDPAVGTWSTYRWAEDRNGFLFFTTNADTRTPLRPLISMWMDLLIQRLIAQVDPSPARQKVLRPVWLFIDEVYTLQQLPRLQDALTLSRKANLRVVLGFQGKSQLEELYGRTGAETLLSQPQTKVILQTKEPGAAHWASSTLGQATRERTVESITAGVQDARDSVGYHQERRTEPIILDSAIMGLPNRTGFLKFLNSVVKVELALTPRQPIAPAWVPREARLPETLAETPSSCSIDPPPPPAETIQLWK